MSGNDPYGRTFDFLYALIVKNLMLSIKIVQLLYFDKFCSRNWKNGQKKKDRHKCGELRTYDGLSALVRNIGHTF